MISIALTAVGNRAWGDSTFTKWVGLSLMTVAAYLHVGDLWAIPVLASALFLWRNPSSRPWLHVAQGKSVWSASARSSLIMFYALTMFLFDLDWTHLVLGVIAVFAVPACYKLASKQNKVEAIALAECLAGAMVGIV